MILFVDKGNNKYGYDHAITDKQKKANVLFTFDFLFFKYIDVPNMVLESAIINALTNK